MSESPVKEKSRPKYHQEIQAMMYTFGDSRHPLASTASAIESIIHGRLMELIVRAAQVSLRRGGRSISAEDLIFALRRQDPGQSVRLRDFLGWREVRKTAKTNNNNGNADDTTGAAAAALVLEEGNAEEEPTQTVVEPKAKKRMAPRLVPWDHLANVVADGTQGQRLDWCHESSVILHEAAQKNSHDRLALADQITRTMSQAEYLEWTECRQASFTYKKPKKFRDWLGPLPTDHRLSEEAIECLGSMACDLVRHLTQAGLRERKLEEQRETHSQPSHTANANTSQISLFAPPPHQSALLPRHIQVAAKKLQRAACSPASWFPYGLPNRQRMRI